MERMLKLMERLPGAERLALTRRRSRRHKRVLAAERAIHKALLQIVGPDDVCLDCGANVGLYTAFMARTGATVHAFEPDPLAYARLQERMEGARNVILHRAAVGVVDGCARLHRKAGCAEGRVAETESSSLLDESAKLDADSVEGEVEVIGLPRFIRRLPAPPQVVKLDVEGAEVAIPEALLAEGLPGGIGHLFVEMHDRQVPSLRRRILALHREIEDRGLDNVNLNWG